MTRVTVEDCVTRFPNRFEPVMMAARRARYVAGGAELSLDRDNDKNTVVALREIAERTLPLEELREALVKGHQRQIELISPLIKSGPSIEGTACSGSSRSNALYTVCLRQSHRFINGLL